MNRQRQPLPDREALRIAGDRSLWSRPGDTVRRAGSVSAAGSLLPGRDRRERSQCGERLRHFTGRKRYLGEEQPIVLR